MSDLILLDGDQVVFQPTFGLAMVVAQPGHLQGSGPATLNGKKIGVDGDETRVSVPGCMYTTALQPIPGTGTLKIASLAGDQRAGKTKSGGAPVLLVGSSFEARFEVQAPAQQPTPGGPVPDPTPSYSGSGQFITANTKFTGC